MSEEMMLKLKPSVCYRTGELTDADYDEAIEALQDAKRQAWVREKGCSICTDTGHFADTCNHNPLLIARRVTQQEATYRCFHCGAEFFDSESAREHFGASEKETTACLKATPASESAAGDVVKRERLYEDALQYIYDFTGSKPIGSAEYQIHMYIYSIFQSAEKGEFND